jgi:hypothetical protein
MFAVHGFSRCRGAPATKIYIAILLCWSRSLDESSVQIRLSRSIYLSLCVERLTY